MIRIWSELRGARTKEMVADAATAAWVVLWGTLAWQLYQLVAAFAEAGRLVRSGGEVMIDGGRNLGDALAGIPLVGPGFETSHRTPSPAPAFRCPTSARGSRSSSSSSRRSSRCCLSS